MDTGTDATADLIERFLAVMERYSLRVEVELEAEPPVVVAYAHSGVVFAAGWMSEDGLIVRIRLDAQVPKANALEHVDGGSLTYEAIIRTPQELDQLETTLQRSERLARTGSRN